MKRKMYDQLLAWKTRQGSKPAVLIEGARRVGKSYIAEQFARNEYRSAIIIDFGRVEPEIKELFTSHLTDLDNFFQLLSTLRGVRLYPHDSLIVFDEVQLFPPARAAIKYLVQDGRFDYLETGSLLSIKRNVRDILIPSEERSFPMHPMDLEEFAWAAGAGDLYDCARDALDAHRPMGPLHRKATELFRQYLIVGGMPQAVQAYVDGAMFQDVDAIKRDILRLYRQDIGKYAQGYETKVEAIFDEIPGQLLRHERRFKLSSLRKGARFRSYEDALFWLTDAMIVNPCFAAAEPSVGLRMARDSTRFKAYMGDTGLLISHAFDDRAIADEALYKKLLLGKLEVNEGMIYENAVAQMLTAAGHKLYYYANASRNNTADRMEIDFLVAGHKTTNRHNIAPIEVKSGKRYRLASLNKFRQKFAEQTREPYVIHDGDYREEDGIRYVPAYMTPFL